MLKLCVPLASAAILAGCRGQQDRTAIDHATDQQKQNQEVTVTGCLGTGVGTTQYMLTAVQLAPLGEQPSDAASTTGNPITPDAQVRLAMNDDDELARLVGQKVTVTGRISDDGRSTIGTSGTNPGHTPAGGGAEPRDDKSHAASDQHHSEKVRQEAGPMGQQSMANGTFPELTVTRVDATGEKCQTWPIENRR
ncbi:MAG TPA: hypothetical protein VM364_19650 [Vicinamibacterales bacterium]|nr:hypothetical protein [Vicinamibacterales bacterium]